MQVQMNHADNVILIGFQFSRGYAIQYPPVNLIPLCEFNRVFFCALFPLFRTILDKEIGIDFCSAYILRTK